MHDTINFTYICSISASADILLNELIMCTDSCFRFCRPVKETEVIDVVRGLLGVSPTIPWLDISLQGKISQIRNYNLRTYFCADAWAVQDSKGGQQKGLWHSRNVLRWDWALMCLGEPQTVLAMQSETHSRTSLVRPWNGLCANDVSAVHPAISLHAKVWVHTIKWKRMVVHWGDINLVTSAVGSRHRVG